MLKYKRFFNNIYIQCCENKGNVFFKRENNKGISLFLFLFISFLFFTSCSHFKIDQIKKNYFSNSEFEKDVSIKTQDEQIHVENSQKTESNKSNQSIPNKDTVVQVSHKSNLTNNKKKSENKNLTDSSQQVKNKKKNSKKSKNNRSQPENDETIIKNETELKEDVQVVARQPELEDSEGFENGHRLPKKNPFKIGEKVVHAVRYFSAEAGRLSLQVKPMAVVNDKQTYHFLIGLKTSRLFSSFFSVDNEVSTFLDAQMLVPYVLKININETNKVAQSQSYFDHTQLKAKFWEKKVTKKNGEEEKKYEYDILPFSQNAYSGLFYMRIFDWKVGKQISFRVAEDQKNIVFKGEALLKETLETDAGQFEAIKIKAHIISRGALSQTGDVYIWLSNDEHKYVLKIEAKIKIGSLISEVVEIQPGS